MTPKERAERSAATMWSGDRASAWLGMKIESVDEGAATLTLTVKEHHTNGLGVCHGGVTFSLADSAFAFACNSRNQATLAQYNSITYCAPAHLGDTLTAVAREVQLMGRSGVYDVTVSNQGGATIAVFRGHSRTVRGALFEE